MCVSTTREVAELSVQRGCNIKAKSRKKCRSSTPIGTHASSSTSWFRHNAHSETISSHSSVSGRSLKAVNSSFLNNNRIACEKNFCQLKTSSRSFISPLQIFCSHKTKRTGYAGYCRLSQQRLMAAMHEIVPALDEAPFIQLLFHGGSRRHHVTNQVASSSEQWDAIFSKLKKDELPHTIVLVRRLPQSTRIPCSQFLPDPTPCNSFSSFSKTHMPRACIPSNNCARKASNKMLTHSSRGASSFSSSIFASSFQTIRPLMESRANETISGISGNAFHKFISGKIENDPPLSGSVGDCCDNKKEHEFEEEKDLTRNCDCKEHATSNWGIVVQSGKEETSETDGCYLLTTCKSQSNTHTCSCTRFTLTRAKGGADSFEKQMEDVWLR